MEIGESAVRNLTGIISSALKEYRIQTDTPVVTDIHLQLVRDTGELIVLDDDKELGRAAVSELTGIPEQDFYSEMETLLRSALQNVDSLSKLDSLNIWKPYSFVMTDEEGEVQAELMLIDDETQLVSQTLMAGLDEDLEKFLKDLMLD